MGLLETLKTAAANQLIELGEPIGDGSSNDQPASRGLVNSILTRSAIDSGAIADPSKKEKKNGEKKNGSSKSNGAEEGTFMAHLVAAMAANKQLVSANAPQRRVVSSNGQESSSLVVVDPQELGKQIIAHQGGETRMSRIISAAFGVGGDYVGSIGTAVGNRAGRLLGADLPPEEYLSEPARNALGLVSEKTLQLSQEMAESDFQTRARDYAKQSLAISRGPIVARDLLVGNTQLREDEVHLARQIAVQVIREQLSTDSQIAALTHQVVESTNLILAENIFTDANTKARKAQFGLEIKEQLNPDGDTRIPVLRIKPKQLIWSALLDAEEKAGEPIIPALTPNERGQRGIDIEMDISTGDIFVLKGGSLMDTTVWPADETRIDWQQDDKQSIFSDAKVYRGIRKWLLYRGRNMEVGHIVLAHQKQKRSISIPIIVRFPDGEDYWKEKPAEAGGYALTLGLAGLRESFQFANLVNGVLRGQPINDDTGTIYAQRVSQTRLAEQRFRPRLLIDQVKQLVERARRSMDSDQQLVEEWQKQTKSWQDNLEVLRALSNRKRMWVENIIKDSPGLPPNVIENIEDTYDRRFPKIAETAQAYHQWLVVNSEEYRRSGVGIQSVEQGIIALLEQASVDELS